MLGDTAPEKARQGYPHYGLPAVAHDACPFPGLGALLALEVMAGEALDCDENWHRAVGREI